MEELAVKKEFTDIYTQDTPYEYLREMRRLEYRIPDLTKPLYLYLAKEVCDELRRPINILDIGSSYGINSALMIYDLTMSELDDFFLRQNPTKEQAKQFFKRLPKKDNLNFYQIDISEPALKFSEDVGLCKKGICVNLEAGKPNLKKMLPRIDMVIATGCIGYIGHKAFTNLFESVLKKESKQPRFEADITPLFAFSSLRMFDMKKIRKTFDYYGFCLAKSEMKPIRQRRFSDRDEMSQTLSLLHNRGIETESYEDDGYLYADFYVGTPQSRVSRILPSMEHLKMKKSGETWHRDS